MDISFDCDSCGKHLVIDEAGAGITIDCPGCGKPVYVPSTGSQKPSDPPTRVEVRSAAPRTTPPPSAKPQYNSLLPPTGRQSATDIHPSIAGGVTCLLILVVVLFVGFLVVRENGTLMLAFVETATPVGFAALLCGVYGICTGHVKHGVLIVVGVSLISGLSNLALPWIAMQGAQNATRDIQRQTEEMLRQIQKQFQK
jgi:predicted RNA-binding Zn-ribbon protein involved in translation (DUF1610 family)